MMKKINSMGKKFLILPEHCNKTHSYFFFLVFLSLFLTWWQIENKMYQINANLICFMLTIKAHLQTDSDNNIASL